MKLLAITLLCLTTQSCTIIGGVIGKQVDDQLDTNRYKAKYAVEGLKADVEVIKVIMAAEDRERPHPDFDYQPQCKAPKVSVCSAQQDACWCRTPKLTD